MKLGAIPDDIKPFYEQFNNETPLTPEEEAARKAAEDEDAGGKGKKKAEKKKDGKKKGKKGKGGDDDGAAAIVKVGPSEAVKLFDEFYDDYTKDWVGRNESDNYK